VPRPSLAPAPLIGASREQAHVFEAPQSESTIRPYRKLMMDSLSGVLAIVAWVRAGRQASTSGRNFGPDSATPNRRLYRSRMSWTAHQGGGTTQCVGR
jgi:hypothetical protein